jgi:hypothetical protein
MIDLSILLPSIRWHQVATLLDSINHAFAGSWELIIVGPFDPKAYNLYDEHIKFVQDYGSPTRCTNIALEQASGKLVTWMADDGIYLKDGLNLAITHLLSFPVNIKNVVTCKYYEGVVNNEQAGDDYWRINNAIGTRTTYVPWSYLVFNLPIMYTEYLKELGGFDCRFEASNGGHIDLAVRAQRDGAIVHLYYEPIAHFQHMKDTSGDHAPIHHAHLDHDEPLYRTIYNDPKCINRTKIDLNNWKNSPARWHRRFG